MVLLGAFSQAQAEEYSKSYSVSGRAAVHVHVDDSQVRVGGPELTLKSTDGAIKISN
jgi:hypothetical protein